MKRLGFAFGIFIVVMAFASKVSAQCAMCRATAESSLTAGDNTIAAGLNTGILYLMVIPYIALTTIGILWYRNSKRNHAKKISPSRPY